MKKAASGILSQLKEEQHKIPEQQKTMLGYFREKYSPFQILIATLMSARTKDITTIPVAEKLFMICSTPGDFIQIPTGKLEKMLYPIGFYRSKAANIKRLSVLIKKKYSEKVPEEFDELIQLPGVGRKTANCVLCYAFSKPAIAVDVHVHRIANRIGLVNTKTAEETETELKKILPVNKWADVNETLVKHGQAICLPRKPRCGQCPVKEQCDYINRHQK